MTAFRAPASAGHRGVVAPSTGVDARVSYRTRQSHGDRRPRLSGDPAAAPRLRSGSFPLVGLTMDDCAGVSAVLTAASPW